MQCNPVNGNQKEFGCLLGGRTLRLIEFGISTGYLFILNENHYAPYKNFEINQLLWNVGDSFFLLKGSRMTELEDQTCSEDQYMILSYPTNVRDNELGFALGALTKTELLQRGIQLETSRIKNLGNSNIEIYQAGLRSPVVYSLKTPLVSGVFRSKSESELFRLEVGGTEVAGFRFSELFSNFEYPEGTDPHPEPDPEPVPIDPKPNPDDPKPTPIDPKPTPVDPKPTPIDPKPTPVDPKPTPIDPKPIPPKPTPPSPTPPRPTPVVNKTVTTEDETDQQLSQYANVISTVCVCLVALALFIFVCLVCKRLNRSLPNSPLHTREGRNGEAGDSSSSVQGQHRAARKEGEKGMTFGQDVTSQTQNLTFTEVGDEELKGQLLDLSTSVQAH